MDMKQILSLIGQPAFLCRDGQVCWCNPHAQQLVREGTALCELLEDGGLLFSLWDREGSLQVPLLLNGLEYDASACATGQGELFLAGNRTRRQADMADVMLSMSANLRRLLQTMMTAAHPMFEVAQDCAEAAELNRAMYRLLRLCNQYSDGGQLLSGCRTAHFRPTELHVFFDSLAHAAAPLVELAGRRLRYLPLKTPVRGDIDEGLMERAIYNLLDNALQYTPPGGEIGLQVERRNRVLLVQITDSGEGIRPELLTSLFERFETPLGDGRRGAGLGLPIAREIVRLHHGSMTVTSDAAGTKVQFYLPLLPAPLPLRSPMLQFDQCGGLNHALVELSDALPSSVYHPEEVL